MTNFASLCAGGRTRNWNTSSSGLKVVKDENHGKSLKSCRPSAYPRHLVAIKWLQYSVTWLQFISSHEIHDSRHWGIAFINLNQIMYGATIEANNLQTGGDCRPLWSGWTPMHGRPAKVGLTLVYINTHSSVLVSSPVSGWSAWSCSRGVLNSRFSSTGYNERIDDKFKMAD